MLYSLKFIVLSLFKSDKKILPPCKNYVRGTDSVISTLMYDTYCCYDVSEMHLYFHRIYPSERLASSNTDDAPNPNKPRPLTTNKTNNKQKSMSFIDLIVTRFANLVIGVDLIHPCVILTLRLSRCNRDDLCKGLSYYLPDEVIFYFNSIYIYIYTSTYTYTDTSIL